MLYFNIKDLYCIYIEIISICGQTKNCLYLRYLNVKKLYLNK